MSFIGLLKNICTLNFLFRAKYFRSICKQTEIKTNTVSKRIFYLDAPDYANVGDQAIAMAIKEFANSYFQEYEFVEILQKDILKYIRSLKKQINCDDLIFLTGGGNMGNIYKIFEAARRYIIQSFPENKIVVFPQTIEYTDDIFGRISCKYSKKIYSHKHLVLCAREEFTYEKMRELYPSTTVILCPDIVLSLNKCYESNTAQDVSLCLRNDCEMSLTDKDRKYITSVLKEENLSIKQISTISNSNTITKENRNSIVNDKLQDFSFSKFVITDRLHAMIFCFLTCTPCIVFGNSNHKIKGVYKFISDVPYIKYMDSIDNLQKTVQKFKVTSFNQDKEIDFSRIVNIIREV